MPRDRSGMVVQENFLGSDTRNMGMGSSQQAYGYGREQQLQTAVTVDQKRRSSSTFSLRPTWSMNNNNIQPIPDPIPCYRSRSVDEDGGSGLETKAFQPPPALSSCLKGSSFSTGRKASSQAIFPSPVLLTAKEEQELCTAVKDASELELDFVGLDHAMNLLPSAYEPFLSSLHSNTTSSSQNFLGPQRRATLSRSLDPTEAVGCRLNRSLSVPYRHNSIMSSMRKPSQATNNTVDQTLKQQFLSIFQPANDNKLALKLFGSHAAVTKERERIASSKHWIIHPASNFRFYFDLFMLIVLLANLMILPVSISFFNDDFSIPWIIFNCFSDTIFIVDLVCNFRTGLINPENSADVVLDPKEIARRYVRSWFFVDLISSIPFDYVVLVISIWDDDFAKSQIVHAGRALRILRMAKLLSLIKLLRLSRLVRYVSQFEEIYFLNIAGVFMRIFNFMCLMMLMAHWSGCIQFLVPMLQGFPRDSWVVINELEHAPWFEQYTWSFFKAISHQLSIGYGRYPPQSISDAWLTVLSMLTGAFTYALFIGHASNLIHSLDASRRQYREKWKQVEEYMAYRKLPRPLRSRISDFYEHRFQGKIFNEEEILGELNGPIREMIINYNCRDLVSSVPFFSHADPNFVTAVITRLHYEFFLPDDTIVREGTLGDRMYFIQEGLVEIFMEPKDPDSSSTVITCLSDGSYFGEICLLTRAKRVASVRAISCCSLFSLQSDHFNSVLLEYPLMRLALESVAAERLNKIGKDSTIIQRTSSSNRLAEDGHSLHGQPEEIPDITPDNTLAPPSPHYRKASGEWSPSPAFFHNLSAALKAPAMVHHNKNPSFTAVLNRTNHTLQNIRETPHSPGDGDTSTANRTGGEDVIITLNDSNSLNLNFDNSAHEQNLLLPKTLPKTFKHSSTAL
ncbi:Potassium/sodium hyperpolarization-activated cyclic nucleotide-gated channel 4 [Hypsibius exemplaris]|uniref:Potassium/sodium hyperpolarization-activated cyclic nucleotide-gated channel 4 n=1 Tax=Hypsibius exemplaris TaxID=2072580 RepID=A0A1W0X8P3_HYPEX|nr:Potassium/sodium hyperpolarization-activated cyclic nucleotide-gated channel 4 [Hypsibius exemplaris]